MTYTTVLTAVTLLAVVLQVADFVTTIINMRHGAKEETYLTRRFIERLGVVPGVLVAKLIAGAVIGALWWLGQVLALIIVAVFYITIIWNNLKVARHLGLL